MLLIRIGALNLVLTPDPSTQALSVGRVQMFLLRYHHRELGTSLLLTTVARRITFQ
jgi:hypothetical protein